MSSLSRATGITYADYATNSFAITADMEEKQKKKDFCFEEFDQNAIKKLMEDQKVIAFIKS